MKVFVIIPARYHSNRFEGKPLADILGKPMIQHVYEQTLLSSIVASVTVATDDKRISQCVHNFGGKVIMTASHHRSGTDRVAEAARILSIQDSDIIVNIQGDQPIFDPGIIDQLAQTLTQDNTISVVTPVKKMITEEEVNDPNNVKVTFDTNGFALYFSRSVIPFTSDNKAKPSYYKHLGIYSYRRPFLERFIELPEGTLESAEKLEQLRALEYGYRIKIVETVHDAIEVNTQRDLERVKKILSSDKKCP